MSSHGKQVKWSLLDQAMVSGTNFLLGIILVRLLGIEQYGVFVLIWMVVQFFASIQNALIISPMLTIAPKYSGNGQKTYLTSTFNIQAGFTFLLTIFITFFAFLPETVKPDWLTNQALIPLIASLIFFQLQDYARRNLFVRLMPKQAFYIDIVAYGLQLPVIFIVLSLYPSFENALLIIATTMLLSFLMAFGWLNIKSVKNGNTLEVIKSHWLSGKWLLASAVSQWLSGNYFFILAGSLMGPAIVGAIKAAQNFLAITHIVFQALENVVPSEASRRYQKNGTAALKSYLMKIGVTLLISTGLFAAIAATFTEQIFTVVYGNINQNSINAMLWFVPIYILMATLRPINAGLRVIEKTGIIFLANALAAIFTLLIGNYIVTEYQLIGVMGGLLMVQIIMVVVSSISLIIAFNGIKNTKGQV